MSLSNDSYGRTVSMTSDGTSDTYVVGGSITYMFPTGTPQASAYLKFAIDQNLAQMNAALTDFINAHYTLESRVRWIALWIETYTDTSKPTRLAYINQLTAWGIVISGYVSTYVIQLMALTDPDQVAAKVWSFSAFEVSDPKINLITCMQITN